MIEKQFDDADYELVFDYMSYDTPGNGYSIGADASADDVECAGDGGVFPNRAHIREHVPGTGWVVRVTNHSVKTDEAYENVPEAGEDIRRWMDFYNQRRKHLTLEKRTPDTTYCESLNAEAQASA